MVAHWQSEIGSESTPLDLATLLTYSTGQAPEMCAEVAASTIRDVVLESQSLAGGSRHEDMTTRNDLSCQVHEGACSPAIAPGIGVLEGFLVRLTESAQRAERRVATYAPIVQTGE